MKKSNLKFLALPMCLSVLMVGCAKEGKLPEEHVAETNVQVQSLYQLFKPDKKKASLYSNVTKLESKVLDFVGDVCLTKTTDKDTMNNVIEKYELYDAVKGSTLFKLEHTYPDGAYGDSNYVDDYDNTWKQPTEMVVNLVKYPAPYLKVETYTYTRIADEILEKEEDNDGYTKTVHEDYYALDGTKLASFNIPVEAKTISYSDDYATICFGNIVAEIEIETGKVAQTWKAEKEQRFSSFDFVGEQYGVYLKAPYGLYGAVETYTKTGKLINRYCYESGCSSYILNNGNVLIQYENVTEGVTGDIVKNGQKYNVKTILLDTLSGNAKEVDTEYYFLDVYTADDVKDMSEDKEVTISDSVFNVAFAVLKNGKDIYTQEQKVVFMNSAIEVSYVNEPEHPEINEDSEVKLLSNGQYAVRLDNNFASYVILDSNFNTVRYLPLGAEVTDDKIVLDSGVYTLDMELDYKFETGREFVGVVGDSVLLHYTYSTYEGEEDVYCLLYERKDYYDNETYYDYNSFYNEKIMERTDDYVVFQDLDTGCYMIVTESGYQVLESATLPELNKLSNGGYLITVSKGTTQQIDYIWSVEPNNNGGDQ